MTNPNPYEQGPEPYPAQPEYAQQPYPQQPYPQQPYPATYQVQPVIVGQKSKIAAGLLGIFLGTFGIHNFYLGFTSKAVIQLILGLTVIFAVVSSIWGLVEGILILSAKPNSAWDYDANGVILSG